MGGGRWAPARQDTMRAGRDEMQEFVVFGVSPRGDMLRARAQATVRRRASRYALALLLARNYEVFPLLCLECGGELRILAHLGEPMAPPRIAPVLASPLWTVERLGRRSSTVRVGSVCDGRAKVAEQGQNRTLPRVRQCGLSPPPSSDGDG